MKTRSPPLSKIRKQSFFHLSYATRLILPYLCKNFQNHKRKFDFPIYTQLMVFYQIFFKQCLSWRLQYSFFFSKIVLLSYTQMMLSLLNAARIQSFSTGAPVNSKGIIFNFQMACIFCRSLIEIIFSYFSVIFIFKLLFQDN